MSKPWYKVEDVRGLIGSFSASLCDHAELITTHLNLAFSKGKQIGRGEAGQLLELVRLELLDETQCAAETLYKIALHLESKTR